MRAEGGRGDGGHEIAAGGWSRTQLTYPSNLLVPIETWLPRDLCLRSISAGGNHSVFLTDEGDVWACGCNYNGTTIFAIHTRTCSQYHALRTQWFLRILTSLMLDFRPQPRFQV